MAIIEANGRSFAGALAHRLCADATRVGPSLECGWQAADGALEVRADRLGFIPLFYWSEGERLIVSDSIREIAARLPRARLDDRAVAAYLQLGYYIGNSTLLEGVQVLPPAACLRWDGALALERQQQCLPKPFPGGRGDAVAEYQRLFALAVAARLTPKPGRLTLSGGRDSRHIVLEMHRQGGLPREVVTLRRAGSNDDVVASTLAARLGVRCIVAEAARDAFTVETEKNRLNFYMADENGWYLHLLDQLDGPVFDGLAGDVLSNGLYFEREVAELIDRGNCREAARLFTRRHGGYLSYLSAAAQRRFNATLGCELIAEEFELHRGMPNPVQSFVFWNRTRREIALLPIGMARTRVDPLLPYTDDALLAFFLSLPHAEFGAAGFHDEVIRRTHPAFADLAYASKVKPAYSLSVRLGYALQASRRLAGHLVSLPRLASYAAAVLAGPSLKPLENPFSRLYPLLQACDELGIEG